MRYVDSIRNVLVKDLRNINQELCNIMYPLYIFVSLIMLILLLHIKHGVPWTLTDKVKVKGWKNTFYVLFLLQSCVVFLSSYVSIIGVGGHASVFLMNIKFRFTWLFGLLDCVLITTSQVQYLFINSFVFLRILWLRLLLLLICFFL